MRSLLACILSFVISIVALYLFYTYVSIPIIPVITLYLYIALTEKLNCSNKYILGFFLLLISLLCIYTYSFQIYASIKHYPTYGNFLSIIFDGITVLSFISVFIMFFATLINNKYENN